jgi:hypothetical protein
MRPKQALHEYVLMRLLEFVTVAERYSQTRHSQYDAIERLWLNYVSPDELGPEGQPKTPNKRAVVVPFTYAACQTVVSHIYGAFSSRPVLLPLRAVAPENDRRAEALEAVLEAKHVRDLTSVRLRALIEHGVKYGQGRFQSNWQTERESVIETLEVPLAGMLGMPWPMYQRIKRRTERVKREGPVNLNIPARDYMPDPRVPGWNPQAGEFVCVRTVKSKSYVTGKQRQGVYFNTGDIGVATADRPSTGRDSVPNQSDLAGPEAYPASDPPVTLYQLEVRLVPADWKAEDGRALGSKRTEEIWLFTIANKAVVIQAEPMPNRHGQFRVATVDAAIDVDALFSPSFPEITQGMQEYSDFALNSRMANIRMGLLMAFLYNPEFVEEDDVYSQQPGIRMRVKPEAVGRLRSLSEAIHQLPVNDITQGLLQDIAAAGGMIEQTLGATSALQGMPTATARSATEMQGVIRGGQMRVAEIAALMWAQGVVPWGMLEISDAQQFLSEQGYVRLTGDARRRWPGAGDGRVMVGPDEIQGEVEISPVDLRMPVDPQAEGRMWMGLAMAVTKDARLNARYDAVEMFEEGARKLGAVNIGDFINQQPMQTQVMPDEQVIDQAERGNLVPQPGAGSPFEALLQSAGMGAG